MKAIHKRRLLKLAEHLERGKLKQDKWHFCQWHQANCQTAGCAIGEASFLWPQQLERVQRLVEPTISYYDIRHRKTGRRGEFAAADLFGLSDKEAEALFTPLDSLFSYHRPPKGLKALGDQATRKQVAANIRRLLKLKEKEARND